MIDKILNSSLLKGNTSVGIHIYIDENSNYDMSLLILQKKKSKLEILNTNISISNIEDLKEHIPANKPVYLAIDGKGIIHKKVNSSGEIDAKTALSLVLPNAVAEDFLIEINEINSEKTFVSLARKESINEIISELSKAEIKIHEIYLGCFSLNHSIGLFGRDYQEIQIPNYKVDVNENRISGIEKVENNYNETSFAIGDSFVSDKAIVAFSLALSHFIDIEYEQELPQINENKSNYLYRNLFIISGWSILAFLFTILLVNYLMFDYYNKKSNDLSYKVGQNKDLLAQLDTLSSQIKRKDEIVKKSGFFNNSRNSYYADRIAFLLDDNIVLTQLEINPLLKKVKQGVEPQFTFDYIIVKGISKRSTDLNDWIHTLKEEDWVKAVNLQNYVNETGQSTAEFELEILIKTN